MGIDQGSSKTYAIVGDDGGNVLGFGKSYGACHSNTGMKYAMKAVKEAVNEAGFLQAEVITQFCNIRRVKVCQKCFDVFRVFLFYQAFDFVYVFFVYFHDCSCLITNH